MMLAILVLSYLCQLVSCYINPVIDTNNPDPSAIALPDGSGYLAVATSNHANDPAAQDAFPIYYSSNMVDWELRGHVFPAGQWPAWCSNNMWAPEIHWVNGRFLAYFSCSEPNTRHSVGVAVPQTGDDPFGPYVDALGVPMIYHNDDSVLGCIDQHYFKDPKTGKDYITWKTDQLFPLKTSVAYIQEITADGTAFKDGSHKVRILEAHIDVVEMGTNEGMWLMYREDLDTYFLFYSTSLFELPSYRMMVARSDNIMGPYVKGEVPVVETDWDRYDNGVNSTFEGPGHGSVLVDSVGDWWLVYHSWRYGKLLREPGRVMLLDKIEWHETPELQLWPRVGNNSVPSDYDVDGPALW